MSHPTQYVTSGMAFQGKIAHTHNNGTKVEPLQKV